MELHVWGTPSKLSLLSPSCIAVCWYMALCVPAHEFEVVTSSNTDVSHSGELPTLLHKDGQAEGFLDIIRFLNGQGYSLETGLAKEQQAINEGLILYVQDKFQIITDYCLFLNKTNYEQCTRSLYSQYLPFPVQYNAPIVARSKAKTNCARVGLNVEDKTEVEEEMVKSVPTVSKIQRMKMETMIEDKLVLKNSVTNMSCLRQTQTFVDKVVQLQRELGNDEQGLFGEAVTSGDLIVLAHVYVWTHGDLPDQFLKTFLDRNSPELIARLETLMPQIESKMDEVQIRGPSFSESPNLFNTMKHLFF